MGLLDWISRITVSIVRVPLRGVDWLKAKLGYISVPALREFVYLDQTSVISLIASTTGGVTEQKSTVRRRQISGSITGGLGSKTSPLTTNVGTIQEKSSEAVRRYVIQSNFKELYEMRAEDMIISDGYEPQVSILRRAWNTITPSSADEAEITEIDFERGSLAEMDVSLGSHEVYQYYAAIESIVDMFDTFPDESEFTQQAYSESEEFSIEELEAFSELFEHLLAGLVPIVGRVENYGVVVHDGTANILSTEYATENDIEYDPVNIVGFVNSEKFWQDETRFLFDDDEYTVYCRLDSDEVSDEWMPIKLVSVVDSIVSGLGESVSYIPEAFEGSEDSSLEDDRNKVDLNPRLKSFIEELKTEAGLVIEPDKADEVIQATLEKVGKTTSRVEGIEDALEELEQELEERGHDYDLSDTQRAELIDEALVGDFDHLTQGEADNEWYLEVSFTAIYW